MRSGRDTRQRRAIRAVLDEADRPLAPLEIHERALERVPRLGIATVYRTVNRLVDDGLAVTVDLPEGPVRFERTGKGHHHHFLCRACDGVFDVSGCPGGVRDLTPRGFRVESHDLVLHGLCEACAA